MTHCGDANPPAIVADRFREAVRRSLEPARGTYIYDSVVRDVEDKTSPLDPCGYCKWLRGLLAYCSEALGVGSPKILDLGCGAGELTTIMNLLGYDAVGADVSERALELARILADENHLSENRILKIEGRHLPFNDDTFDIVVMISVLEHIDDEAMTWLVPELKRVCRGIVFIQVPSSMKVSDDHTGLKFVPWLPHRIASFYVALRGKRYRYVISESKRWDVVHRNLDHIERLFTNDFNMNIAPSRHSFPQCVEQDAVLDIRKRIVIGPLSLPVCVPLPWRYLRKALGKRIEYFYPYYNLIFRRAG